MKARPKGLALVPILVLGVAGGARGQAPAPPTLSSPEACPAVVEIAYDVSAFAGADRVRWQIRRAAPGQDFAAAVGVDSGDALGATGSFQKDLRSYGAVLDGTRYFVRVRARQGTTDISGFSAPAVFELDFSLDEESFAASPAVASPTSLEVDWSLAGEIGACADRVAIRIVKADGSATVAGEGAEASGTAEFDLSASGPGDYDVHLHARFGGSGATDAVGRESASVPVTIGAAPGALAELQVRVEDAVAAGCNLDSAVPEATVRLAGTLPAGERIAETSIASNGSTAFTVPIGGTYRLSATAARCTGQASAIVTVNGSQEVVLTFPATAGCHDPAADVETRLTAPASPASPPIALQLEFRHTGEGGPSPRGRFRVRREYADGTVEAELVSAEVAPLCSGESRAIPVSDSRAGLWTYRALAALSDADPSNNEAEVTVSVLQPLEETSVSIAISSFRLQGGATTVARATPITLDATFTGATPDQYKAAVCGAAFDAASFQAFPATPPPSLPGFSALGTQIVCFQARAGSASTAVARDTIQVVTRIAVRPSPGELAGVTGPVVLPVEISSFQIRGGAPFVTVNKSVPLNVTATGGPTEYRAVSVTGDCDDAIASAAYQPFSSTTPPTISFAAAGQRFVCIQLRRAGGQTSAVARDDITVFNATSGSTSVGAAEDPISTPGEFFTCNPTSGPTSGGTRKFAVGVVVRSGLLVDALGLRCAELTSDGGHGNVTSTGMSIGGGGFHGTRDCPSGEVLLGVDARFGTYIDSIQIVCIPWSSTLGANGTATPRETAGGPGGDDSGSALCPLPYSVGSVHAQRKDNVVDRIFFNCILPPEL